MAIQEITVDMSLLKNTVETLNGQLAELTKGMNDIFQDIAEMDRMWDGEANNAFKQQFEIDHQMMNDMFETIRSIIDCYDFAEREYTKCEDEVYGIVHSIKI